MLKIAICDDEKIICLILHKVLMKKLEKMSTPHDVQIYNSGIELLDIAANFPNNLPDLVLLDVDMPGVSGLDIAEKMNVAGMSDRIIFVTSYEDKVFRGLHYCPFNFVRKVDIESELPRILNVFFKKYNSQNEIIEITSKGISYYRSVKEILYIQMKGRKTCFYCKNGEKILSWATLDSAESQCLTRGFCKINRATLVNLMFIEDVENNVLLKDGTALLLNKQRRDNLQYSLTIARRKLQ